MTKRKKKFSQGRATLLFLLVLVGLGLFIARLLNGTSVALFSPKGLIAEEQLKLMIFAAIVMLAICVPTLLLLYFFAWKYRESNQKDRYNPNVRNGKFFVFSMWAMPTVIMLVLASVMWPATHRLHPQKLIASSVKPLTIQVVAMRWKWLFIYPEQNIASVNFVQVPVGTPVQFELTADETPMSSFWIPHLGGQLYAMTGHANRLNLMANMPGDYPGSSAEINGPGFAGMKFIARAGTNVDFEQWVQDVRFSSHILDSAEYSGLLKPSESNPVKYYSSAETNLYDKVLMKYSGPAGSNSHTEHGDESP